MQSFALVGLLAAIFSTAAAAKIRSSVTVGGPTPIASSSAIFTFTTAPTVALPSVTDAPYPLPTVGHGSGAPVYVCYPIDPAAVPAPYPGNPGNATVPAGPPTSTIGATIPAGPPISSIGATIPAGPPISSIGATIPAGPSISSIGATVPAGPSISSIGATVPAGPSISSIGATVPAGPATSSTAAPVTVA